MVQRWANEGGVSHRLDRARNTVARVVEGVEDRAGFEASVDALPESLQTAMIDLVSLTPSHSEAAVHKTVAARIKSLSAGDREALSKWWCALSEDAQSAVEDAIYGNAR